MDVSIPHLSMGTGNRGAEQSEVRLVPRDSESGSRSSFSILPHFLIFTHPPIPHIRCVNSHCYIKDVKESVASPPHCRSSDILGVLKVRDKAT